MEGTVSWLFIQSNYLSRIKTQTNHEHVRILFSLVLFKESTRWEASDNRDKLSEVICVIDLIWLELIDLGRGGRGRVSTCGRETETVYCAMWTFLARQFLGSNIIHCLHVLSWPPLQPWGWRDWAERVPILSFPLACDWSRGSRETVRPLIYQQKSVGGASRKTCILLWKRDK